MTICYDIEEEESLNFQMWKQFLKFRVSCGETIRIDFKITGKMLELVYQIWNLMIKFFYPYGEEWNEFQLVIQKTIFLEHFRNTMEKILFCYFLSQ